jgi:diacylglycerol O-acyltransferase
VLLASTGLTRLFIRRQHFVNVLVTNLAGPRFPLYVAGARLIDAFAITPIAGNITASFAVLSYDGGLDLSVHVDADAWPDLEVLVGRMSPSGAS